MRGTLFDYYCCEIFFRFNLQSILVSFYFDEFWGGGGGSEMTSDLTSETLSDWTSDGTSDVSSDIFSRFFELFFEREARN